MSTYEKGIEQIRIMAGDAGLANIEALNEVFPELGQYVVQFGFGEIYAREGLDLKQKELLSIGLLVSAGDAENQLMFHYKAAIQVGLTISEIKEILIHCIPHVGIPRVMNAFHTLKKVLDEK